MVETIRIQVFGRLTKIAIFARLVENNLLKQNAMKKINTLAVVASMFALASCGGNASNGAEQDANQMMDEVSNDTVVTETVEADTMMADTMMADTTAMVDSTVVAADTNEVAEVTEE